MLNAKRQVGDVLIRAHLLIANVLIIVRSPVLGQNAHGLSNRL
jgi:hypothetical protein